MIKFDQNFDYTVQFEGQTDYVISQRDSMDKDTIEAIVQNPKLIECQFQDSINVMMSYRKCKYSEFTVKEISQMLEQIKIDNSSIEYQMNLFKNVFLNRIPLKELVNQKYINKYNQQFIESKRQFTFQIQANQIDTNDKINFKMKKYLLSIDQEKFNISFNFTPEFYCSNLNIFTIFIKQINQIEEKFKNHMSYIILTQKENKINMKNILQLVQFIHFQFCMLKLDYIQNENQSYNINITSDQVIDMFRAINIQEVYFNLEEIINNYSKRLSKFNTSIKFINYVIKLKNHDQKKIYKSLKL